MTERSYILGEGEHLLKTKVILNGRFEVTDQGDIFKIKNGKKSKATISKLPRGYCTFTYYEKGRQTHVYVHRVLAEAFIPNPQNLPQINHKDGDASNNKLDNLEWCTAKDNIIHAYKTKLIDPMVNAKPCEICGTDTRSIDGICPSCKLDIKKEVRRANKFTKIGDELDGIDLDTLTSKQRIAVEKRLSGLNFPEIAKEMGISKQAAEQLVKYAIARSTHPIKKTKQKEKLEKKLILKKAKLDKMMVSVSQLNKELHNIQVAIDSLTGTQTLITPKGRETFRLLLNREGVRV